MILLIIGLILALTSIGGLVFLLVKVKKEKIGNLMPLFKYIIINSSLSFIGFLLFNFGFTQIRETSLQWYEYVELILGSIVLYPSLFLFISSFFIYFYGGLKDRLFKLYSRRVLIISTITMIVGLVVVLQGLASSFIYPLIYGLRFSPFGFVRPGEGSPNITFYAIFILLGALFVYKLVDHKLYKEYGKHGLVELTFFVGLICGVLGSRILYVIGEWDSFKNGSFLDMLAMWDGGLTIIGGIIFGIAGGVICFLVQHKKRYNPWLVADIIIPTILLAQAIGRWGNFFNIEVYGGVVSVNQMWFVPRFIQLQLDAIAPGVNSGTMFLPLFFIESLLNIAGYFLITLIYKKGFRKYYKFGDLAFLYVSVYGIIRACLEPLRNADYIMGNGEIGFTWSSIWAYVFILVGILGVIANHLIRRHILKEKSMNQRYKVLIFDLDGTTANTDSLVIDSYRNLYKKYRPDFEPTDEYLTKFSGPSVEDVLRKEFPKEDPKMLLIEYLKTSKALYDSHITVYDHQLEVIDKLQKQGYLLAMDTNKETNLAEYTLKLLKMEEYFTVLVGLNDVKKIKPDPEGINKIIKHFGVLPSEVLFIGDTKFDYLAAANAGIDCALMTFRGDDDPARECRSRYHYDSYLKLFEGLSRK